MARWGGLITVGVGKMPSSQVDFTAVITTVNFDTEAINGGAKSILNGGGNLRCYTKKPVDGGVQIPIEVVTFVTGLTPEVQVWVLHPNLNVGDTVYIEADTVATSQPAFSAAFGRDNVWVAFYLVVHASEIGTNGVFIDSTGNGHDTTLTTGASLTTTSGNPLGGTWPDFTQAEVITFASSYQAINNTAFTVSCWVNSDSVANVNGLIGSRYNSPDSNWAQVQSNGQVFTKAASVENFITGSIGAGVNRLLKLKQNNSSLDFVSNGVVTGQDTTITGGEAINSAATANNFRVGTYFDNSGTRRYNGRVAEFRIKRTKDSVDYDAAEYNNQSDPSSFWVTGPWEDQDAGSGFKPFWALANRNNNIIGGM